MAGKLSGILGGAKRAGGRALDVGARAYMLGQTFGNSGDKLSIGARVGGALISEVNKATLGQMGSLGRAISSGIESRYDRKTGGGSAPSSNIPFQQIKGGDVVTAINNSTQQVIGGLNALNATQRIGFNTQTTAIREQASAIGALKRDTEDMVISLREIYEVLNKMGYQGQGRSGAGSQGALVPSPLGGMGQQNNSLLKNLLMGMLAERLLDGALDRRVPPNRRLPAPGGGARKSPGILRNMLDNIKGAGLSRIGGGIGGILGGLALDYGSEYATESGYGKTGAGLGIMSNVLSGAGAGGLVGSAFGGIGAVPGAIVGGLGGLGYGLYDKGSALLGSNQTSDASRVSQPPAVGPQNGVTLLNRRAVIVMGNNKGTIVKVLWQDNETGMYEVEYPDGSRAPAGKRTIKFIDEQSSRKASVKVASTDDSWWNIFPNLFGEDEPTGKIQDRVPQDPNYSSVPGLPKATGIESIIPPPAVGDPNISKRAQDIVQRYKQKKAQQMGPYLEFQRMMNAPEGIAEPDDFSSGLYLMHRQANKDALRESNRLGGLLGTGRPGFLSPNMTSEPLLREQERIQEDQQSRNQIEFVIKADKITYEADELTFDVDKLMFKIGGGAGGGGAGAGTGGAGGGVSFSGAEGFAGGMGGGGTGGGGGGAGGGADATAVPSLSAETKAAAGTLQSKGTYSVPTGGADPFAGYSAEQLRSQGVVSHTNADGTKVYSYAPGGVGSHADKIGGSGATQAATGTTGVPGTQGPRTAATQMFESFMVAETGSAGGALDPGRFIRTRVRAKDNPMGGYKQSSAYGPVQMTKTYLEDFKYGSKANKKTGKTSADYDAMTDQEKQYMDQLIDQGGEMLKRGENDPVYGAGGKGTLGETEEQRKLYASVAQRTMVRLARNSKDYQSFVKSFRGGHEGAYFKKIAAAAAAQGTTPEQLFEQMKNLPPEQAGSYIAGVESGAPGAAPTAVAPSLEAGLAGMTPANAPAATQAGAAPITGEGVGAVNQLQAGKIRGQMLNEKTEAQLRYISQMAGVEMDVTSGEQMDLAKAEAMGARKVPTGRGTYQWVLPNGKVVRTGSTRHDESTGAADVKFKDPKTGKYIDMETPEGRAKAMEIVKYATQAGMTGFGYGTNYMGTETMHLGGGSATSWNKASKGSSQVDWIEEARKQGQQMQAVDATAWLKQQQEKQLAAGQLNVQEANATNLPPTSPLAMTPAKKARIQQRQRDAEFTKRMMDREGGMPASTVAQPVTPPVQNPVAGLSEKTEMNREAAVTRKNTDATNITNNVYGTEGKKDNWGPDPQSPSKFDFQGWAQLLEQTGFSQA